MDFQYVASKINKRAVRYRNFGDAAVCGQFRHLYRALSALEQLGHPHLAVPAAVRHRQQVRQPLRASPHMGNDTADGSLSARAVFFFPAD